jgi:K+-sensing histidine kinase KdpD
VREIATRDRARRHLHRDGDRDGAVLLVDRQVLAAVLANFLENVVKFTRPGTAVTESAVTLSVGQNDAEE